ncbi:hypothetical protein CDN99_21710 [Roseateles aquatilis]|uniref:Cell wall hydrolase SleB domain-containing protein n=1 Tax=Roseateles aquatilis TaxID=431061 RepID=A0A246IZE1_9BURK|nr:cell wall hydrolase [Roseateles aquatilis]OWQ85697.1 hypothetical protein CDN99_21710 [Roseateles aquatilis]
MDKAESSAASIDRWATCLACGGGNPASNRFCGRCGHEFSLSGRTLEASVELAIQAALPHAIKDRLTDSNLVELQLAERVAERLSKWIKYIGIPVGVVVAGLSFFGIQASLDLSRSHERLLTSLDTLRAKADSAATMVSEAERQAASAKAKSTEAGVMANALQAQMQAASATLAQSALAIRELDRQSRSIAYIQSQIKEIEKRLPAPKTGDRERAIDLLARTIWGEARGIGKEGMEAIAAVVANRTNAGPKASPAFGSTVEETCLKPWQFSTWNENDPNGPLARRVTASDQRFAESLAIATATIDGQLRDRTDGATLYHSMQVAPVPAWSKTALITRNIGGYLFYRNPS